MTCTLPWACCAVRRWPDELALPLRDERDALLDDAELLRVELVRVEP